ncbi:MAG: hypothetical protein K5866_01325 [Treponema sp.]|nr:hypothetical protein [Treponema sp.]
MKKFFISILLLAIAASAVFYIGWVQIKVKADQIGIIISKTNGVEDQPVENGKFYWSKLFLLPTNAILKTFEVKPLNTEKTVSGQLPSGELYTSIYNSSNNFTYSFTYTISLSISPQAIVELFKENKISSNEDLQEYLQGAADTIAQLATNYILEKSRENPKFQVESIRRDDLFRAIKVYNEFPQIDLLVFAISQSKIPDFKLYSQLQNQFIQNQDKYFLNSESKSQDQNSLESQNNDNLDEDLIS